MENTGNQSGLNSGLRVIFKSRLVPSPRGDKEIRETAAILCNGDPNKVIKGIMVRQHVNDQDCKYKGQKWAMEKLMKAYPGEDYKDFRAAMWEQFFSRSKHPRGCKQ